MGTDAERQQIGLWLASSGSALPRTSTFFSAWLPSSYRLLITGLYAVRGRASAYRSHALWQTSKCRCLFPRGLAMVLCDIPLRPLAELSSPGWKQVAEPHERPGVRGTCRKGFHAFHSKKKEKENVARLNPALS